MEAAAGRSEVSLAAQEPTAAGGSFFDEAPSIHLIELRATPCMRSYVYVYVYVCLLLPRTKHLFSAEIEF
jgi:hypothetical protein